MARLVYFISHPNVLIDAAIPVPQWHLSDHGKQRMVNGLSQPWINTLSAVYCSDEQKAVDGATILAGHLNIPFQQIPELGENDRSSTGFLNPKEFEQVANAFFAHPHQSIRGWEKAVDAQTRIVSAVNEIVARDKTQQAIAIVSHGAVGTLLYCWLSQNPISRQWDQPANGGGNYFSFQLQPPQVFSHWQLFDLPNDKEVGIL